MKIKTLLIFFGGLTLLSGCTNIELRDRNFLAKPHMEVNPNPLLTAFNNHVNFAREGTAGGEGVGGGGCGCN